MVGGNLPRMTKPPTTVHWSQLTMDSPREDVLAAVDEHERQLAESRANPPVFPEVPEGFQSCVQSIDGTAVACYGLIEPDPVREAQDRAGEEDQSVPGWGSLP